MKNEIKNSDQLIEGELYNVRVKDGKTYINAKFHFCKKEYEDGPCNAIFEDENKGEFYVDTDLIGLSYFITPIMVKETIHRDTVVCALDAIAKKFFKEKEFYKAGLIHNATDLVIELKETEIELNTKTK